MRRLLVVIRRITIESYKNPLAVVQLLTVLMLLAAFVLAMVDWISSHDRVRVEVPLLLVGVTAILIIVVRTSQGFSLSVAVLIIGTVVAGDRFMLAITALLKGLTLSTLPSSLLTCMVPLNNYRPNGWTPIS